jgi:predicted dehydrogenase
MKVAVIGYGYWGPNLVRNFNNIDNCEISHVSDLRNERLLQVKKLYPNITTTTNVDDIMNDISIEAVIIATPVFTHFTLAKKALEKGKHVLLEKPMTSTSAEALKLYEIAQREKKQLMVDHTFLYTGAVQKMKQLIDSGSMGKIKYFDSTRINLGLFQPDINVLWDLAPHDISVLNHLIEDKAYSVNATGVSHTNNNIENIAYLTINYKSGFIAHFNCSWTSPVKIRTVLIGGDQKMLVFNDLEPTEKIRIYDTGYDHKTDEEKQRVLVDYRAGDVHLPKVDSREALFSMASDFINSINQKTKPISDFESGLNVIKILEASQQSIKQNGKEIILN